MACGGAQVNRVGLVWRAVDWRFTMYIVGALGCYVALY